MSDDLTIMTDTELSLLRTRFMANPDTVVDPAVAQRLLATAEYYRNNVDLAIWPHPLEQVTL